MRDQGRTFRLLWLTAWLSTVILLPVSSRSEEFRPISDRDYLLSVINEREHQYQQRFEAQEKALRDALNAAGQAVTKAEAANEKRFDSVNEFRNQLRDQTATFITRAEYSAAHKQLTDQVAAILNSQVPRSEHETRWAAEATLIAGLQQRLEQLANRQFTAAGQSEGSAWLWGIIVGGVGLLAALASVSLHVFKKPGAK